MIFKHKKLMVACVLNDRTPQKEIYSLNYKAMYNTSFRIANNCYTDEDIIQYAFNKISKFEWRSSFGTWLNRIVVNMCVYSLKNKVILLAWLKQPLASVSYPTSSFSIVSKYGSLEISAN